MINEDVKSVVILDGTTTIAASGSDTSSAIVVGNKQGYFALQLSTAGDGTLKVEYHASADGTNFQEPSGADDIITGVVTGDGTVYIGFSPVFCEQMKIKVTETGGADSVTPTVTLLYR